MSLRKAHDDAANPVTGIPNVARQSENSTLNQDGAMDVFAAAMNNDRTLGLIITTAHAAFKGVKKLTTTVLAAAPGLIGGEKADPERAHVTNFNNGNSPA